MRKSHAFYVEKFFKGPEEEQQADYANKKIQLKFCEKVCLKTNPNPIGITY
jgi:hypothetical protein